ncbi:DHA2 family efflux MFS transporter permease subunit [Serinibacter salmoneus]|uniref:EmrB/QacA subfamily drug resistance transporter n=1 Tax=Serinibacter salmoneus TaxID=556530 RepID=A0A2A9CZQ9_9MICO|nr:EmrB/QacA subfamily drug resistance transporter [Serinibacter salmoneus]
MKNGKALAVLATGLGMIILDGTIVAVALPDIIEDLKLDLSDAQWVNASYSVIFAALLLTFGRLGDRLGRREVFVGGIALFAVGSLLASMATGPVSLIGARLIQGVGGAAALPSALSTVTATFTGKSRVPAFAVWGVVASGSAAIGPLLGGWLTTAFTWPWIFLVNLPISVFVILGAILWVPNSKQTALAPGLDIPGLLLSALGFGAIVFALVEGQTYGWWTPHGAHNVLGVQVPADAPISATPVLLALGALLVAGFILWERHRARAQRSALLDLTLFRIPTFRWGNTTATTVAIGEFGIVFVMPLFLVNVLGLDTLKAGLVIAAMAFGAFWSGAMARHLAAAIGAPGTVVVGLALEVIGTAATALVITATSSPWLLAGMLAIYGFGLGLASAQLTGTTLLEVPAAEAGQGSAAQSTVRQLGSALGTAIVGSALAVALASAVPSSLAGTSISSSEADQLATATSESAGGVIEQLREQGTSSQLGSHTTEAVTALSDAFATATSLALWIATAFLFIGLISSILLVRHSPKHVKESAGTVAPG